MVVRARRAQKIPSSRGIAIQHDVRATYVDFRRNAWVIKTIIDFIKSVQQKPKIPGDKGEWTSWCDWEYG
jgi:hypothetical protein